MKNNVLIVGSGAMAKEYLKVLHAMKVPVTVVGRSVSGAQSFEKETGMRVIAGGLESNIAKLDIGSFTHCIVTTNVTQLFSNVCSLLEAGAKRILVEKPFVIDSKQLDIARSLAEEKSSDVFVAYNRRFFSSVIKAREIIADDGGLEMVKFDFTERTNVIETLDKDPKEKARWVLANSTHVIDLAFYFTGTPQKLTTYQAGSSDWHPSAMVFTGAGVSKNGILFSYGSDWGSAGRWGLELFTPFRKLRLCPMEKLLETRKGTVDEYEVELDDDLEKTHKPGLYRQTDNFLLGVTEGLCSLGELEDSFKYYCEIAGYFKHV